MLVLLILSARRSKWERELVLGTPRNEVKERGRLDKEPREQDNLRKHF